MSFKWWILGKKEYEAKCRVIEQEARELPGIKKEWIENLSRLSAKAHIDNLIQQIKMTEIYRDICSKYDCNIDVEIKLAWLRSEKRYRERLYKEKYGD